MPNQLSFTLKFVHDFDNEKTRIDLDFSPEFSTEFRGPVRIPPFKPTILRGALNYVSDDVILKVVEYIHKQEIKKSVNESHPGKWDERKKLFQELKKETIELDKVEESVKHHETLVKLGLATPDKLSGVKSGAEEMKNKVSAISARIEEIERDYFRHHIESLIDQADKDGGTFKFMDTDHNKKERVLSRIQLEKASPVYLSFSELTVVNNDVPPPKPKLP